MLSTPIPKISRFHWFFGLFIIISNSSYSQSDVFLQLISTSNEFPYFSEDEIRNSNQFFLNLTAINPDPTSVYAIWMEIQGPGIQITSEYTGPSTFQLIAGETKVLLSGDLAPFFNLDQLIFNGFTKEDYLNSGLPEGNYRICFQLMDVAFDRSQKVSNQSCQILQIRKHESPTITLPKARGHINLNEQILFTWQHQIFTNKIIAYQLLIFEKIPGVSHEELLVFYHPVLQETVYGKVFVYNKDRFDLKPGKEYVAFVQAYGNYRQLNFQNNGYSLGIEFSTLEIVPNTRSCPLIECDYNNNQGIYDIIIEVSGVPPGTQLLIMLDGNYYGTSTQDPIIIPDVSIGLHTLLVGIPDGCYDECEVFVEGDCEMGEPCEPLGPMDPCLIYSFDHNCDCIAINGDFPDSDYDEVCDLIDVCPGFNDNIDDDEDGVPNGCDICSCYDDAELTENEVDLLTDNDPSNDPPSLCGNCPCDDILTIDRVSLGQANCDYCLSIFSDIFPTGPNVMVSSYSYRDQSGVHNVSILDPWDLLVESDFEYGLIPWISNALPDGRWCDLYNDPIYASSGNYSVRLRNQGDNASLTSEIFDFTQACMIKVAFSFVTESFDNGNEDFFLEISNDGGNSFTTVNDWNYGIQFQNGARESIQVYIPGPFTSTTSIRIRCDASSGDDYLYIDDIKISSVTSPSGDCISTAPISGLVNFLQAVINEGNYSGNVSYYENQPGGLCGAGSYLTISGSSFGFESISFVGWSGNVTKQFTSPNCEEMYPGQEIYILTANINCTDPEFIWNTGETTQSIQIPDDVGGYSVSVTCADECEYVETIGNPLCMVGAPCSNTNDPCYPNGFLNEFCDCIPNTDNPPDTDGDGIPNACDDCPYPPDYDGDSDGIPDCQELICPCTSLPHFNLDQDPGILCSSCFPLLLSEAESLNEVTVNNASGTFSLHEIPGFHFPYCAALTDNEPCLYDYPPLSQFRRDFLKWGGTMGWNIRMLYEDVNGLNHCSETVYFIEGLPSETNFAISYSNEFIEGYSFVCEEVPDATVYTLSVATDNCDICNNIAIYDWSDPSIPENVSSISPYISGGGYIVTVTCDLHCQFVIEYPGNCLVGTPCDDANPCTSNDVYNADCFCEGVLDDINDTDGDGIADACDECEGFSDHIDDDHDGVPNGCDECYGFDDALLHDEDPSNDPQNCIQCELISYPLYGATLDLLTWTNCGTNGVYVYGMYVIPPGGSQEEYIFFQSNPEFYPRYCITGNCPPDFPNRNQLIIDIREWLINQSDNPAVWVGFSGNSLIVQHTIFRLSRVQYLCGSFSNLSKFFTISEENQYYSPLLFCDDGDPCTTGDQWNEECRCVGMVVDSDGDNVPDCEEDINGPCWGANNFWDENNNGIPDCDENEVIMTCGSESYPYCEYYTRLLEAVDGEGRPVVVRYNELGDYDPRVISYSLVTISERLKLFMESVEWDPINFNYPELIQQLQKLDSDPNHVADYIDPFNNEGTEGYLTVDYWAWACDNLTQEQLSLIIHFSLETVNYINDPNSSSFCFEEEEVPETYIYPGCANALEIPVYEDEYCVLRRQSDDCPVEFIVDCDGNCEAIPIENYDPSGNPCLPLDPIGTVCTLTPQLCAELHTEPEYECAVWEVIPNPDYDAIINIGDPCLCRVRMIEINGQQVIVGDLDTDGVCDDDDQCPGIDDDSVEPFEDVDNDDDGIHDCHDACPDSYGSPGDECNDLDILTYDDIIQEDCSCKGHFIDWDGDGIPETPSCDAIIDEDGDGYPDAIVDDFTIVYNSEGLIINLILGPDGLPDCDVCPGLDDTELNSDGIPVCLQPPYTPIGCPVRFDLIHEEGIVLVFDASEITIDLLPQPISVIYETVSIPTGSDYFEFDYLIYTQVREVNGQFEVLYAEPSVYNLNNSISVGYVGITYADHQQCVLLDQEPDYVELGCPDQLDYYVNTDNLVMTFEIGESLVINEDEVEEGEIAIWFISEVGPDITNPTDPEEPLIVSYTQDQFSYDALAGLVTITLDFIDLADISTYSGSITMVSSGSVCEFAGGGLVEDCEDEQGEPVAIGEPCDDNNPCTEFDEWIELNGQCLCQGEPKIDTDGDGLCDDLDQAFSDLICPTAMENEAGGMNIIFEPPIGFNLDPNSVHGTLVFLPQGGQSTPVPIDITQASFLGYTMTITLEDDYGLDDLANYIGDISLPNGLVCSYNGGEVSNSCSFDTDPEFEDPEGEDIIQVIPGNPCNDGNPCTHHDKYVSDGINCECIGEESNDDTDLDGICDEIDPCPIEECPCEDIALQDDPENPGSQYVRLINGNEVEIHLVEDDAIYFSHLNLLATGGPEDIQLNNLPYSTPLIIPNLPYGYYYVITITGVCKSGEESEAVIEIDVPFAEGQFVCGIEIKDIATAANMLLPELNTGDEFTAADFKVTVLRAQGSRGLFTGTGYIAIPYFHEARVNVSYTNITINHESQMVNGVIHIKGFGFSILGDELTVVINEAINDILHVLDEIDKILDVLIPLLQDIEAFVAQTGELVPEHLRECLLKNKELLENYLKNEPNPDPVVIQGYVDAIRICQEEYDAILAAILNDLLGYFNNAYLDILQDCENSNHLTDYQNSRTDLDPTIPSASTFNASLPTEFFQGSGILSMDYSENAVQKISEPDPNVSSDPAFISAADAYYLAQRKHLVCIFMDKAEDWTGPDATSAQMLLILKILLEVGNDFAIEIGKDISNQVEPSVIQEKSNELLLDILGDYLQKKSYGN